ncbi:uncharacterized protein [Amphiura filiformis]|uniref:uncharacterized protein n=1 Tax=Amphiura filiformis TaxID=82378 RepID=UPI003B22720C
MIILLRFDISQFYCNTTEDLTARLKSDRDTMAHDNTMMMENQSPPTTYSFDPISTATMQNLPNVHKSHRQLKAVLDAGTNNAAQMCQSNRVSLKSGMSYEQFLEGMLFRDEQILGSGRIIYYTDVIFKPVTESGTEPTNKDKMTKGRLFLTNHRILLLSAEEYQGLSFAGSEIVLTSKRPRMYSLNGCCSDVLHYQCVPLGCIKSVELNARLGVSTSANIIGRRPCCCCACWACCGFDMCLKSWFQTPFLTTNENKGF